MSISKKAFERLEIEAVEAKELGLTKIASNIKSTLNSYHGDIRESNASYVRSEEDMERDVQACLWQALVKSADFFDKRVDSKSIQRTVDFYTDALISDFRKMANIPAGAIGPFEPSLMGEERSMLEITEEDGA